MAAFNYTSLAWRKLRDEKLRNARYICEACQRNCQHERGRILVHHDLGARRYPELALQYQWLDALCITCHETVHRAILYPRLLELACIGANPHEYVPKVDWGPVQCQMPLDLDAANDDNFTLDPPIEVAAD
jgi:hypothetical protein